MWVYILAALSGFIGMVCFLCGAMMGLTYPWPEWACNLAGFGLYLMGASVGVSVVYGIWQLWRGK